MSRRVTGFTLVELLIALAIFALLSVLGYRAVAALADGESRLTAEASRWRALDALFARFEDDCRAALPRAARRDAQRVPAWIGAVDAEGNGVLELSRAGPEFLREPGSAGQRVGYRLRAGAVEVLYWPALDVPANVQPAAYQLAFEITTLRFAYLDSRDVWRDTWPIPGEAAMPRAVRVSARLGSGESVERWFALQ